MYGVGKDRLKEEWMHYIRELLHYGYLEQSSGEYPVLKLGARANGVLFKGEKAYLTSPVQPAMLAEPVIYQQLDYEKPLLEHLRKLRNRLAHEENVPAYLIFSDSTLLDLATYLPQTKEEISGISGFGAYKTEKYGNAFLEMVQDYCNDQQLSSRVRQKQPKKPRREAAAKERDNDTKQTSLSMYRSGMAIDEIAAVRELSPVTIESHLSYYVSKGELDLREFVSEYKQELISQAIEKFGSLGLRQLKDNLPENISYSEIKMVIAGRR